MAAVSRLDATKNREKLNWVLFGGWMLLILSTLGLVRTLLDRIEAAGMSDVIRLIAPAAGSILIIAAVIWLLIGKTREKKPYLALAGIAVAAVMLCRLLDAAPVERLHLFEYGAAGVLAWRALGSRADGFERAALASLVCMNAGFLDESIQGLLPSRYYDSNDVLVNFIAGALGVILAASWPQKTIDARKIPSGIDH